MVWNCEKQCELTVQWSKRQGVHAKDANFHNSTNLVLHAAPNTKKPCLITYAQIPRCVKDIKIEPSTFSNEYAINTVF